MSRALPGCRHVALKGVPERYSITSHAGADHGVDDRDCTGSAADAAACVA
ncbi:MAG: hypothetical protein FJ104_06385, partial [Deltaproteobacteria bacterium]|nr:hypothetical protein [Deltaproteobacteria bacterium]